MEGGRFACKNVSRAALPAKICRAALPAKIHGAVSAIYVGGVQMLNNVTAAGSCDAQRLDSLCAARLRNHVTVVDN